MSPEELTQHEPPLELSAVHEEEAAPAKHTSRLWIVLLVLLAIGGLIAWRIYSSKQAAAAAAAAAAKAANRPTPVLVADVQQRTMPIYFEALGTVTAYNTVTVKSRVDGQLIKVNFVEGQKVRKGQLLLQIDPAPYAAAVAQAEGQYAKDLAAVNDGKAEAARYTALYQAGVVSRESEEAQISTSGQAEGSLKADQAAIQAAKVNLAYTRITSPIDGVVGLRQVDAGNIVHAADTNGLVVVTQLQPISVIFTLPEDQLPQVRQRLGSGQKLEADAYDRAETTKLATGNLLTVDNQIDPTTGMDKLKAVFPNKDLALFPNQFVNIRLILEERPNVLVVPAAALQTGSSGSFVYLVSKDAQGNTIVNAQPIVTTLTEGSQMLVDSGLQPGQQVVIDGQEKLRNGSPVMPSHSNTGGGSKKSGTPDATGAAASTGDTSSPSDTSKKHHHDAGAGAAAGQGQ
ncbi:MAG TPA: efflux RND transporter periplasmic adaptor subunit [Acidobacteriaceae bacterium]|jgi:multidrug efflux system membrane fusion protein|nr:efflux RND transporter periplasmic adaptor subunit [Acidobacteriaceae bacterium]